MELTDGFLAKWEINNRNKRYNGNINTNVLSYIFRPFDIDI